jgi:uncharacterized protein
MKPIFITCLCLAALAMPIAAHAQLSESYTFLKAVRDRDGAEVTKTVDKPISGAVIINAKDQSSGETALQIVTKERDLSWMRFFLAKGADVDSKDTHGDTALINASRMGFEEGVVALLQSGAKPNLSNNEGDTAIIAAVQAHHLQTVRLLLGVGADAERADRVAGLSAHDYARRETRYPEILLAIESYKAPKPKAHTAGPTL